jgi:transcriptional regulator with GAF, ATPase, and Fis domain
MAEGPRIRAEDLALCGDAAPPAVARGGAVAEGLDLRARERAVVLEALERSGWVQKDAARLLGVTRRKLNYMIQRMGIVHPAWRRNRPGRPGAGTPLIPRGDG